MKAKAILTISIFFFTINTFSQQIGDGFAPGTPDFTLPLNSGVYGYPNPVGSTPDTSHPWQHLLVIRHANPNNNHQLQIGSAFASNDRLFFRKLAGGLEAMNPSWIEIATRGTNTFVGIQKIIGNLSLDGGNPNSRIDFESQNGFHRIAFNELRFWDWQTGEVMTINDGNIGIGTTNPSNKLDVNGTIHSKEVKVDMSGWPDFVFKKEYDLPTLDEVEKQIKEKGHLANIPSEEEVLKKGINLGEMNAKLLQKIEELTLYTIEQNKKIIELEKQNKAIEELKQMVKLQNEKIEKIVITLK